MQMKMFSNLLDILLPFGVSGVAFLIISFFWKRRHWYYHTWKIPGISGLPLLGAAHLFLAGKEGAPNIVMKLARQLPPLCKIWLGPQLYLVTSNPDEIEVILSKSLNKGDFYSPTDEYFHQSLLISNLSIWKKRRKVINPSFNINVLNSMAPILVKHANRIKEQMKEECGYKRDPKDMFPLLWKHVFEMNCETLGDVDADLLIGKEEHLRDLNRYQRIQVNRFFTFIFQSNYLFSFTAMSREGTRIFQRARDFVERMINVKRPSNTDPIQNKRFLNRLVELEEKKTLDHEGVLHETLLMLFASSETTAVALSSMLLVLGFHPEVQEKLFEEVSSIDDSNLIEEINHLNYLERVIKENLRLFPPVAFFLRELDTDVVLDSCTLPAGARIFFLPTLIHTRKDLWPDRFLPEEVKKRSRCAYIPFSYGPRNCIGSKYAMMALKIVLAVLVKSYKVVDTVDYKRFQDVKHSYTLAAKATKGYRVILEERAASKD